jgi:zinc transporter 1/2/3
MELLHFKYISAAIIFVSSIMGAAGSIFVTALKWRTRLEALAGGAFLGAGMLHLLPDASDELEKVEWLTYPLAPTITVAIFVIFTLIDLFSVSEADAAGFNDARDNSDTHVSAYDSLPECGDGSETTACDATEPPLQTESRFGTDMSSFDASTISLYFMVGMDSTIEGLTLGVLHKWPKVIAILIAIVAHKPVEAFAIALIILKRRPTRLGFFLLTSFYSLLSPIGIGVGIELRNIDSSLMLGIIESCSAGAFLFMGCREWMEMFQKKGDWGAGEKLWHYGSFLFGIMWLCTVAVMESFQKT